MRRDPPVAIRLLWAAKDEPRPPPRLAARATPRRAWLRGLYLDRPISFSARLAERLRAELGANAIVELADCTDGALKVRMSEAHDAILASGDGALLRRAERCIDLTGVIVERALPDAWILRLA